MLPFDLTSDTGEARDSASRVAAGSDKPWGPSWALSNGGLRHWPMSASLSRPRSRPFWLSRGPLGVWVFVLDLTSAVAVLW